MEMPTRKKRCICLEFADSTKLFGEDDLVLTNLAIPLLFVQNLASSIFCHSWHFYSSFSSIFSQ